MAPPRCIALYKIPNKLKRRKLIKNPPILFQPQAPKMHSRNKLPQLTLLFNFHPHDSKS